jgi:sugar phosphate isomerase/epimerase
MPGSTRLLSINHIGLKSLGFEERMRLLCEEGVPATGVWFDDIKEIGLAEAKRILALYPLKIVHGAYAGFFNQSTKKAYLMARMADEERIEIANELGIETIIAMAGPLAGIGPERARTILVEGLSLLSRKLEKYGSSIKIGLEPVHPLFHDELSYVTSAREALRLLDEVDRPNIGLMVDLYHLWQEPGIIETLEAAGPRIVGCQLSDWRRINRTSHDRVLMGDGCIPLAELVDAIERAGWNSWYEVEILSDELWRMGERDFVRLCKSKYQGFWQEYEKAFHSATSLR